MRSPAMIGMLMRDYQISKVTVYRLNQTPIWVLLRRFGPALPDILE